MMQYLIGQRSGPNGTERGEESRLNMAVIGHGTTSATSMLPSGQGCDKSLCIPLTLLTSHITQLMLIMLNMVNDPLTKESYLQLTWPRFLGGVPAPEHNGFEHG